MLNEIAPGVWYLPVLMSNVYFIGKAGESWLLVDAGVPGGTFRIRAAAEQTFGRPPEAIILTHGHFDHVGALPDLADYWGVPIYAHRLEAPFLTGRSDYPEPDPTVGGFMAQTSRLFPHGGYDFGDRVRLLPEDGSVPYAEEWRSVATPGHTSGHISLFRESDRTLIAGDALITVNQENAAKLFSQVREFRNPPAYLTQNWYQARESVIKLASLRPATIAAGHGLPMAGENLADELAQFASSFRPPATGRYVKAPVRVDNTGAVVWAPPAPHDPVPMYAAGIALAAASGAVLMLAGGTKKRRKQHITPGDVIKPWTTWGILSEPASYRVEPRLTTSQYDALGVQDQPVAHNVEKTSEPAEGEWLP